MGRDEVVRWAVDALGEKVGCGVVVTVEKDRLNIADAVLKDKDGNKYLVFIDQMEDSYYADKS